MSQKKKLTPAQREKKQLAASRRQAEKKQALVKTAVIAGAVLVAVILCAIVLITALRDGNTHTTANQGGTAASQTTAPVEKIQGDGATLETAVATHIAKIEIHRNAPLADDFCHFHSSCHSTIVSFAKETIHSVKLPSKP